MTERMTTREVLDAITRERARLDRAVRAMGAGATTVRVTDEGWTTKDVIAHCIHWAGQLAFGLGAKLEAPAYVKVRERPPVDEWNGRAVAYYRDWSLENVKSELDRVVDALIVQVRTRSDAQLNATDALAYAAPEPLWQQIANETFEHWPEHTRAIDRAARGAA